MKEELILGIDEAGMGPVIGPLIVSGVVVRKHNNQNLRDLGVKDSKMFGSGLKAHKKREDVWESVKHMVVAEKQVIIEAGQLDKCNMHDLHVDATRRILIELQWEDMSEVYIEQIGGMKKSTCMDKLGFWHDGFVYETKADIKFPPVSLASIKAKILRDRIMVKLCEDIEEEYISGYPNCNTEIFLRKYYEKYGKFPPQTRKSRKWAPIEELNNSISMQQMHFLEL